MIKTEQNQEELNKKIFNALDGLKEFEVSWGVETFYSKTIKARSKEEAEQMFEDGDIGDSEEDITKCRLMDESFEVSEV